MKDMEEILRSTKREVLIFWLTMLGTVLMVIVAVLVFASKVPH